MNSIVAELWDEWTALPQGSEEADSSELAGLTAVLPLAAQPSAIKKDTVLLATSRLWALRRLSKLWKNSVWKHEWNVASSISVPASMKGRVELSLPPDLYESIIAHAKNSGSDKWAWLRGVWGGCGSLYVPKSGYYLVMRVGPEATAKRAAQILHRAEIPLSERVYGKHELIVRDQQGIVAFLSKIGLSGVSLRVEDKAILRSMRDQANRMRNCDTANINKTLKAAAKQYELASEILKNGMMESLPTNLRSLVDARIEHPDESLSELGRRLSPPVTKSTVKYRWGRLEVLVGGIVPGCDNYEVQHSMEEE